MPERSRNVGVRRQTSRQAKREYRRRLNNVPWTSESQELRRMEEDFKQEEAERAAAQLQKKRKAHNKKRREDRKATKLRLLKVKDQRVRDFYSNPLESRGRGSILSFLRPSKAQQGSTGERTCAVGVQDRRGDRRDAPIVIQSSPDSSQQVCIVASDGICGAGSSGTPAKSSVVPFTTQAEQRTVAMESSATVPLESWHPSSDAGPDCPGDPTTAELQSAPCQTACCAEEETSQPDYSAFAFDGFNGLLSSGAAFRMSQNCDSLSERSAASKARVKLWQLPGSAFSDAQSLEDALPSRSRREAPSSFISPPTPVQLVSSPVERCFTQLVPESSYNDHEVPAIARSSILAGLNRVETNDLESEFDDEMDLFPDAVCTTHDAAIDTLMDKEDSDQMRDIVDNMLSVSEEA